MTRSRTAGAPPPRSRAALAASAALLWAAAAGCTSSSPSPGGTSSSVSSRAEGGEGATALAGVPDAEGWRPLFDGRTLAGWRGYRSRAAPQGWRAQDGALVRSGEGGDIVTVDRFRDFELSLEWKLAPGGNSGVMYRVTEDAERTYHSGPEMQVLDDARHRDGGSRLTASGALYGLYPAPEGAVKPVGEWNAARIVARGSHVEHWLNGVKMAEAEIGSADWNARVAGSKFAQWPGYAKAAEGHIALQDHGDWVAFRNIRIRTIP